MIANVEWHPGELYPWVGFIVTNMARPAETVVTFYNKRGTCEEGKARSNGHGCHSAGDAGAHQGLIDDDPERELIRIDTSALVCGSIPTMVWPCQGSSKAAISASDLVLGAMLANSATEIAAAIVTANICAILLLIVLWLFNTRG